MYVTNADITQRINPYETGEDITYKNGFVCKNIDFIYRINPYVTDE